MKTKYKKFKFCVSYHKLYMWEENIPRVEEASICSSHCSHRGLARSFLQLRAPRNSCCTDRPRQISK